MIRIRQIKIDVSCDNENSLIDAICKKIKIDSDDIKEYNIIKKSLDARYKPKLFYIYEVDVKINDEDKILRKYKNNNDIIISSSEEYVKPMIGNILLNHRPIVIGSGPAGLFCAYLLASMGYRPLIIERGEQVDKRILSVEKFWNEGILNKESNVQFGEGGAGTFSDGKLNTLTKDKFNRCRYVFERFVECGANEDILISNMPHIGTDILRNVVINLRNKIIQMGGEFLYNSCLTKINIVNNKVKSIEINNSEIIDTDVLVLAIGHSARDTFENLYSKGVKMEPKSFSVGVRIEHKQSMINESQYGNKTKLKLPPAEYKLVYHGDNDRTCYTFCMCPGGTVMASSSEKGTIVTNGMSKFLRDGENANSAVLVNVIPEDFINKKYADLDCDEKHPLKGMYFQKELEEKAFVLGGKNYKAPIQRVEDFLNGVKSEKIGEITPSYMPGVTLSDLNEILPNFVSKTLKDGIAYFDTKLKGFANPDAIMTGVETRSSSPVKIVRNEKLESNFKGLYPCGEGAGYAGGIMTAAMDGIKVAKEVLTV